MHAGPGAPARDRRPTAAVRSLFLHSPAPSCFRPGKCATTFFELVTYIRAYHVGSLWLRCKRQEQPSHLIFEPIELVGKLVALVPSRHSFRAVRSLPCSRLRLRVPPGCAICTKCGMVILLTRIKYESAAEIAALCRPLDWGKRQVPDTAAKASASGSGGNTPAHINQIAIEQTKRRAP